MRSQNNQCRAGKRRIHSQAARPRICRSSQEGINPGKEVRVAAATPAPGAMVVIVLRRRSQRNPYPRSMWQEPRLQAAHLRRPHC